MATLKIAVLYNSGEAQSLLASMILKLRFIADTVTLVDMLGKTEAQMETAIDTITDATQDRVYVTTTVDASFSDKGHLSADVNIVNAKTKIKGSVVGTYADPIEIGEYSTTYSPVYQAWNEAYRGASWPNIVRYLSGNYFPLLKNVADSAAATSITDAGAFTASAHIGQYVYIISGTAGVGQVRKIISNTTGVLNVAAWDVIPTGSITYAIVALEDEALREEAIETYIKGFLHKLTDPDTLKTYYRLLDYGSYDSSYNSINSGALVAPFTDKELLEQVVDYGKKAYMIGDRYTYVAAVSA